MPPILLGATATAAAIVLVAWWYIASLRRSIALARGTGLPYVVAPCSPWFLPWQVTHKLWVPLIRLFPESWWEPWLPPTTPDFSWLHRHDHFARHGDTFILASPGGLHLFTANAEAIRQLTMNREQFLKPTETYAVLSQFGENVLTTEGAVWRMHRKVTAASFNEKNAALVFRESIRQTLGMIDYWSHAHGLTGTLRTLEQDTMRLALNIIGYAGFGLRLPWPHQKMPGGDGISAKYGSSTPPRGYEFSFVDAMATLLENVLTLLLVPAWLLRLIPSKAMQDALASRRDYQRYISELLEEKIVEAQKGEHAEEGMDIMGRLVRSSCAVEGGKGGGGDKAKGASARLSRDEIIGNAFVMMVAGHETTANAIHFTMLQMATNPASQRRMQREMDGLLGDSDPLTWDYETLVNPLMGSMAAACMNEMLRVQPPVIEMPKAVTRNQDQAIAIDGEKYVLPGGTLVTLCAAAVHMNTRYWPTRPSKIHPDQDDMGDYVPERWYRRFEDEKGEAADDNESTDGEDEEDYGGFRGRDTSAQLFRPERGAYIPFSDGARACLGRRIAQVEVIAALAVLFRRYSVELAVDEWASDEDLARMGREQKAEVYGQAVGKSRQTMMEATSLLTLKLRGKVVPVRLVERGQERFVNWMDQE